MKSRNIWSTNKRWHPVEHDLAHLIHHQENPDLFRKIENNNRFTIYQKTIISKDVSEYAASNPIEFVAEVYVGLKSGIKYPPIIMDWYNKYGGPK